MPNVLADKHMIVSHLVCLPILNYHYSLSMLQGAVNVETPEEEYKRRWLEWRQSDSVTEDSSSQFGVDLVREKPVSTHKETLDRKEQLVRTSGD